MPIQTETSGRRPLGLWFRKPVYIYRPDQIARRLVNLRQSGEIVARVPWGDRLLVDNREMIGGSIARLGVHELAVTETIYRLVRPGDVTIDLGANLGYDTSLLAHRVGLSGAVYSFEPHPRVYERLTRNIAMMRNGASVHAYQAGVSDHGGDGFLNQTSDFETNAGGSSIADTGIPIRLVTLDVTIPDVDVALMKMDIEGHELAAMVGAGRTIGRTRHIIFEEHQRPPTPVTSALHDAGFVVYGIAETWRGARLVTPGELSLTAQWDAPTFLATRDPDVTWTIRPDGWRSLRP